MKVSFSGAENKTPTECYEFLKEANGENSPSRTLVFEYSINSFLKADMKALKMTNVPVDPSVSTS